MLFSSVYCQDNSQGNKTETDSLTVTYHASINELKQILFDNSLTDPYLIHINHEVGKVIHTYSIPESRLNKLPESNDNSFNIAKKNLLGAIRLQPKFLPADELGILGEVFIYANAAAFGYALYQHIKKYKDEY